MVFSGKPSRGCDVCRKRRIKCDEALPACSHCVKRQIVCPGYRSQFDVAWRNQNVIAEKSVLRRKNATEKADRERLAKNQLKQQIFVKVPRCMPQDYEKYATDFFLSAYILLPKDPGVRQGLLDNLYPVWVTIDETSPLKPAVTAVASCMLEGWSNMGSGQPKSFSMSHYLKGVEALRKHLQQGKDVGDDVLLASLMLDMYEECTSFMMGTRPHSPHVHGTASLIQHRKRLPITSSTSQNVVLAARTHILTRVLKNENPAPFDQDEWSDLTRNMPGTPITRLDDLNIGVANVQAAVSSLKARSGQKDLAWSILQTTIEVDQQLLSWISATVPTDWLPVPVSGPDCIPQSVRDAGLYHEYCDVYKDIFIASTLNAHCCSRIKLQSAIIVCLQHLEIGKSDTAWMTALEIIQDLADTVCASVPFYLGSRKELSRIDDKRAEYPHVAGVPVPDDHYAAASAFGGYLLIGRLATVLQIEAPLRPGQRGWMGRQMARLKNVYAIRPL